MRGGGSMFLAPWVGGLVGSPLMSLMRRFCPVDGVRLIYGQYDKGYVPVEPWHPG